MGAEQPRSTASSPCGGLRDRRYYSGVRPICTARCSGFAVALLFLFSFADAAWAAAGQAAPPAPEGTAGGLHPRWSVALGAAPSATPVFDLAQAYVPLRGGTLAAVDLQSGAVRWRVPLDTSVGLAVGDGRLFAAVADALVSVETSTGTILWQTPLPGRVASSVYWETGWVLAGTETGELAAFRAEDGALVWRQSLGSPLMVSPAPALDRLYLGLADGRLLSAALATGIVGWSQQLEGRITGLLALDEQLIVGTTANQLISMDLLRGRRRWRWRTGGDVVGAGVADADRIYAVALDNTLRAIDRRGGNLRWTRPLPARPASAPRSWEGTLLVPLVSSEIVAFASIDGAPLFTVQSVAEAGAAPHVREVANATAARVIVLSRQGVLQGLAPRFEPAFATLTTLPGTKVGG